MNAPKTRLDVLLAESGRFPSRARAGDAIRRGCVRIDGRIVTKPGQSVAEDVQIEIEDAALKYVSRAALKLVGALDHFGVTVTDRTALDIGASTGGFTQVLLDRGARHVVAVDVGHGQMVPDLAIDPRVTSLEGLNARDLTADHLDCMQPDLVTCDASFISLRLVMPPALRLAASGAHALLLVKPQFEVGRDGIGKGGLVRPGVDIEALVRSLADWLDAEPGWRTIGTVATPITGGDGNQEYVLCGARDR